MGQAKYWPVNESTPQIGEIVILNESTYGHVALITDIKNGNLILDEANWIPCEHTIGRKLNINNPDILGYWN